MRTLLISELRSQRTLLKVRGQDTDLINDPREKFMSRKTPGAGLKKHLPQVEGWEAHRLHTWGPTPWGRSKEAVKCVCGISGRPAPGAGDCLPPCILQGNPPAVVQRGSHPGTCFSIASGLCLSCNEHIWAPHSTRDRGCSFTVFMAPGTGPGTPSGLEASGVSAL